DACVADGVAVELLAHRPRLERGDRHRRLGIEGLRRVSKRRRGAAGARTGHDDRRHRARRVDGLLVHRACGRQRGQRVGGERDRAAARAGTRWAASAPARANPPACPDTTPPSVPASLTATANGCGRIDLAWSAAVDTGGSGLAGYDVLRNGAVLRRVAAPATS